MEEGNLIRVFVICLHVMLLKISFDGLKISRIIRYSSVMKTGHLNSVRT